MLIRAAKPSLFHTNTVGGWVDGGTIMENRLCEDLHAEFYNIQHRNGLEQYHTRWAR